VSLSGSPTTSGASAQGKTASDGVLPSRERRRVTVWIARAGHERVVAIAAAGSTGDITVTASDVLRTLLSEGLAAWARDCSMTHRGPISGGHCGHCGRAS
jgi:hypothetical protein